MKNPAVLFDETHAEAYDQRFARLSAQREGLYLLLRVLFSELPEAARILCVGAGTGAELLALAREFPGFSFTAVEPSGPMLAVCRRRAEEEGVAGRCTFHEGFIASLPPSGEFDAATSLLVSQFLTDRGERVAFFREIASRLRPGGRLVSADLSADLDSTTAEGLKPLWAQMLRYAGLPEEQAGNYLKAWKSDVAVLPAAQVEAIMAEGGFEAPVSIYQSLFIRAWTTRRRDEL